MDERHHEECESRRAFVKRAAYVAPAILSLAAAPAYASVGSPKPAPPACSNGNPNVLKNKPNCPR